jgi:hypothetical protein
VKTRNDTCLQTLLRRASPIADCLENKAVRPADDLVHRRSAGEHRRRLTAVRPRQIICRPELPRLPLGNRLKRGDFLRIVIAL